MENNQRNNPNEEQRMSDQDQLRGNTMNEAIRQASGNPDMDLNDMRETGNDMGHNRNSGMDPDTTQGMSYNPNDMSAVRSGGTTDMDDQTSGGAGTNTGARQGLGSHLRPKSGTTGSDYDGQDATS